MLFYFWIMIKSILKKNEKSRDMSKQLYLSHLRTEFRLYPVARVVSPPIGGVRKLQFVLLGCEGTGNHRECLSQVV